MTSTLHLADRVVGDMAVLGLSLSEAELERLEFECALLEYAQQTLKVYRLAVLAGHSPKYPLWAKLVVDGAI